MGYRIVRMSEEFFQQFITQGTTFPPARGKELVCVQGLPEGARLVDVQHEFIMGQVLLKFESPEWEATAPNNVIPEVRLEFTVRDAVPEELGDLTPMEEMARRRGN